SPFSVVTRTKWTRRIPYKDGSENLFQEPRNSQGGEPEKLERSGPRCTGGNRRPPTEAALLHRFKPNDANWAFPNLHRTAVGEHPCRLFCLIIVRARQGVPIENVPFGREDKHLVLFRGSMICSPAKQP